VVESTFDEFEKVAEEYGADWMFGLRSRWVVHRVLEKSGRIARFDPASVKPVLAAASIDKPVLFIHGDHDEKIPIGFNRRNFEAVRSPDKQWITVAGGGHSNLWRVDGEGLSARVKAFLNSIH
jgi:pimeloyl-ACP methyl ester carboxylesterase